VPDGFRKECRIRSTVRSSSFAEYNGDIKMGVAAINVGEALEDELVGLLQTEDDVFDLYFCDLLLGEVDTRTGRRSPEFDRNVIISLNAPSSARSSRTFRSKSFLFECRARRKVAQSTARQPELALQSIYLGPDLAACCLKIGLPSALRVRNT
jgi:hypothetical protein